MPKKIRNKRKRRISSDTKDNDDEDEENKIFESGGENKMRPEFSGHHELYANAIDSGAVTTSPLGNSENESPTESLEEPQNVLGQLCSDVDSDKPYDLSTKSKDAKIEDIGIETEENESCKNSSSDDDVVPDGDLVKTGFINDSYTANNITAQEIILAHLSKIQHNFVSNLLQYQANFLAHYHQIQQQMMAKVDGKDEDNLADSGQNHEEKSTDPDKTEDNCSESEDIEATETEVSTCQTESGFLATPNILGNLIPFVLYPNLLPVRHTATAGSDQTTLSVSNPFINVATTTSLSSTYNKEEEEVEGEESYGESSLSGSSPFKEHLFLKCSNGTESGTTSLDEKYSVLESLIGSSTQKMSSSKPKENVVAEEVDQSSNPQYKRKRIAFSAKQYELLQTTFEHNNFPEPGDQQCIARQLKAPYRSIKMWFQNKRANARKKLLPGEKGSGRTANGEKIPGDTDTRFYCDKCPSAFICQKYLNNHMHAHTIFTKSCPKCNVLFTHECLLMTHTLAKCGNKEEIKKEDASKENVDEAILDLRFLSHLTNGEAKPSSEVSDYRMDSIKDFDDTADNLSHIPSTVLSQLNSTLPLLTLLQIHKKQEELKKKEDFEDQLDEELEENTELENYEESCEQGESDNCDDQPEGKTENDATVNHPAVEVNSIPKDLPPLIPTELIKSEPGESSKFAILRELLTNYHPTKASKLVDTGNQEPPAEEYSRRPKNIKDEGNFKTDQNYKPPQNIPEHLYELLNNQNGLNCLNIDDEKVNSNPVKSEAEINDSDQDETDFIRKKEERSNQVEKRKIDSIDDDPDEESESETKFVRAPKVKRLRRRTTVFTETQHRILYLHFTHCNFPDPSMFRILSKLTGLTPHVIKIWFQNERSRQRRQVSSSEEVTKEKKPYKCRDCGVEFAMPAFLVKHCMRHIPTDNVTSQARKCPICMVEFETQKLHSHFMASHNLSISMEEDGSNEKNICHLCHEQFSDLNTLSIHKNEHLKDTKYGDPPQCVECKTTFVNVLCLEAHMATHHKFKWDHSCNKCKMKFYDKILLESHLMTHTLSNNSNNTASSEVNNQSQYLISLIQQLSDPAANGVLPKEERGEECNEQELPSELSEELNSLLPVNVDKVATYTNTSAMKVAANVSFKLFPVKFIPVTSVQSDCATKSTNSFSSTTPPNSLITVISPQFLAIKEDKRSSKSEDWVVSSSPKLAVEQNKISDPESCDRTVVGAEKLSITKTEKCLKAVPNLIPISDATFSVNLCEVNDDTSQETSTSLHAKKETEVEKDTKIEDHSAASVPFDREDSDDPSQVLLYTPYASDYRKRRRTPTHFNSAQRDILEAYYKYDNFPDPSEQLHLSEYLSVPYSVIKTWFQNTRKNHRKHLKESSSTEVGGPFECSECRVCFVSRIYVDSHIRQHQEKQPFQCSLCHLQFPHQAVSDIHVRMGCSKKSKKKHDHVRQFSSGSRISRSSSQETNCEFIKEERLKSDERQYAADKKLEISSRSASNIRVFDIKHDEFDYVLNSPMKDRVEEKGLNELHRRSEISSNCRENTLISVSGLSLNTNSVSSSALFQKCSYCSAEFSSVPILNIHLKNSHGDAKGVETVKYVSPTLGNETSKYTPQVLGYTCPQCNRTFQSFLAIAEHKVKSDCRLQNSVVRHPKNNKPVKKTVSLMYSKLFDLYEVPLSTSVVSVMSSTIPVASVGVPKYVTTIGITTNGCKVKEFSKKKGTLSCANINFLKLHYKYNNFPSSEEINLMSKRLCVERERVAHWFQKQRTRERKGNAVGYQAPHQCKSCSSVFVHLEALHEHEQSVHNPSAICIQFVCPIENCKKKFPNSTLLQTHQMSHEEQDEKTNENDLKVHGSFLEAHYSENNFPSPMDVGFIARRLNVEPLGVHWWFKERRSRHLHELDNRRNGKRNRSIELSNGTKDKPPTAASVVAKECEVCSSAYLDQMTLEKHLDTHITALSLVCYECLADFANPLVYETHLLRHGIASEDDIFSLQKNVKVKSSSKFMYSFLQLQVLCHHFKQNHFAKKDEVKLLSRRLKIPMKHIHAWYRNQRLVEADSAASSVGRLTTSLKNNVENCSVGCAICSVEFVSSRHMRKHMVVHKLGRTFSCDACSKTFCHEVVGDTHALSHYSGLGLKARAKSLEKELKNTLKKLISDCRDAALFPVSTGLITNCDNLSDSDDQTMEDNCHQHNQLEEIRTEVNHLTTSGNDYYDQLNGRESSMLQIDRIDEDADTNTEEEDDELKLVIDE